MKAAREQRGWSQAELGKQAGYSESLIAMVEGFHRMPTPELAKALDRAFKTPEDAATVAEVALVFDALRSEALPKRASRTFMESVAERWKEATPRAGVSPATAATTAATA